MTRLQLRLVALVRQAMNDQYLTQSEVAQYIGQEEPHCGDACCPACSAD